MLPAVDDSAASEKAFGRHNASMRKQSRIVGAVLAVVLVAGAIAVARIWATGEVNNSHLHTVADPPATVRTRTAVARLAQVWQTTDQAATGTPVWQGTVITFDNHTVRGRNARTGVQTWSYYRSNRDLCTAAQSNGLTMVLYRVNGNCDEVTALASDTGRRKWTRTLDMDGHPLNGTPAVSVNPYTFMIASPDVIYAIDPNLGYDHWEYHQQGCTINKAVLGANGILISQNCTAPQCAGLDYCGRGQQLLLRDAYAGRDDKNSALNKDGMNPDEIMWNNFGNTDIPVSADVVISALNPTTHKLDVYSSTSAKATAQLALHPAPTSSDVQSVATTDNVVVWDAGTAYAIGSDARLEWTRKSIGPPTVLPAKPTELPVEVGTARLSLPVAGAVLTVSPDDGSPTVRSRGVTPPASGTATPLGAGYLVAGPNGCAVYR